MQRIATWFLRLVALGLLAGVWFVIPHAMPGANHFLRLVQLLAMCFVIVFAFGALAVTLVMPGKGPLRPTPKPTPPLTRAEVNQILQRHKARDASERHE